MPDDLLNALSGPPPRDKRAGCYYAEWLKTQSPERRAALEAALNNPKWKTTDIFNLIKDYGFERKYNMLRVHRTGDCACV